MDIQIIPHSLSGTVTPPPSKSQAHRLLIAAALSGGISVIHGLADSQDIRATRRCLSAMCAGMEDLPDGTLRVHGLGNGIVIAPPYALLDCGESGSTLRFLIPVGLLIQGEASFTGRGRLMERPLKPYEDLFREKGIAWKLADNVLTVNGGRGYGTLALDPGTYRLPGNVSSQFFTGLLFVMPLLEGDSTLVSTTPLESRDYLEMTRQAQAAAGVTSRWLDENTLFVPGGQTYQSFEATAEADWSQAGFWYAANFLDSRVDIRGLNPDSAQGDKAVSELFPNGKLFVEHPVSKGYFCNLRIGRAITLEDVSQIKKRMQEIITENITYHRIECHTTEAVRVFSERGMNDKVKLLESSGSIYTYYYTLGGTADYYYGNLLPSTGFIHLFDLVKYYDGLLLRIPNKENPTVLEEVVKQEKMLDVFKEHLRWNYIMGLNNVGDFNIACEEGHATDLINVAEALQEKKIAQIADSIFHRGENGNRVKLVLISGPSSSGKTTFSKRLSIQLMTNGLKPYPISLDNYFVDREETPLDENGNYDYESLYALDLELFNAQLQALLRGEEVELPRYNFMLGKKEYKGDKLRIDEHTVLILEGIHALNPELTPQIPAESKYKIYVSALTTISLDDHNWIPTTDNRLLRRIIRDFNYRGYSAQETISRWPSVRAGEDKWIFPYQENADVMFNSALLFEFAVLRCHAEPILTSVPRNCPEYAEAYRLLKFIKYFTPVQDKEIPPTSLLREFLGGSSFKY